MVGGLHHPHAPRVLGLAHDADRLLAHHRYYAVRHPLDQGMLNMATADSMDHRVAANVLAAEEEVAVFERMSLDDFVSEGHFHRLRGMYVYHAAREHADVTQVHGTI